jgi:hypothetical protein
MGANGNGWYETCLPMRNRVEQEQLKEETDKERE